MTETSYRERVEARRDWQLQELTNALYLTTVALIVVDLALAFLVIYSLGGVK